MAAPTTGHITSNDISHHDIGLSVSAPIAALIEDNAIHGANIGVDYSAPAVLSGNRIFDNNVGVVVSPLGDSEGFGFVGDAAPNEIFDNQVGVELSGRMQNQHILQNVTGVTGSGVLGGTDLQFANLIESNTTGVDFDGIIQFNRIARNVIGVVVRDGQEVNHNLLYRNTNVALLVDGVSNVAVVNNTFYAPQGDNLRIIGGSSQVEAIGNIFWAEQGYDIYVANDSQIGFFSDFNTLHATGSGRLVYWTKDFHDILDWQADVTEFDLHSLGTTVVNPAWSVPWFVARGQDDYRLFDVLAGQRFSSPTIDAGAIHVDHGLPELYENLLTNPGFEFGLTGWNTHPAATTQGLSPDPYHGTAYFAAGATEGGMAEQSVDLMAGEWSASELDSENLVVVFGGRVRSADESPHDRGRVTVAFLDGTGAEISQTTIEAENVDDRWELIGGRHRLPVGTRYVTYRFFSARESGNTADSYLDDAFLYVLSEHLAVDQGAYGNTDADHLARPTAHIALRFPDLYVDWQRHEQRFIRWDSFQNDDESLVRIDLLQDGPDGPAVADEPDAGNCRYG